MQMLAVKTIKARPVGMGSGSRAKHKLEYVVRGVGNEDDETALNKADAIRTAKRWAKESGMDIFIDIFDLADDVDLTYGLIVSPDGSVKEG